MAIEIENTRVSLALKILFCKRAFIKQRTGAV